MSATWTGADELRAMQQVQHLYQLGPRSIYEFLAELAGNEMVRVDIETNLARYCRLTPAMVAAVDSRELKLPIFVVDDDNAAPVQAMRGAA